MAMLSNHNVVFCRLGLFFFPVASPSSFNRFFLAGSSAQLDSAAGSVALRLLVSGAGFAPGVDSVDGAAAGAAADGAAPVVDSCSLFWSDAAVDGAAAGQLCFPWQRPCLFGTVNLLMSEYVALPTLLVRCAFASGSCPAKASATSRSRFSFN